MSGHTHVIAKISSGAYSLAPRRKGKSFVWNVLSEILKEDGSIVEGLVYCRSCRKVLKCTGSQTSNLTRHKCCEALRHPSTLKPVNTIDKKEALNLLFKWVVDNCRPFSTVSGSEFKAMASYFVKIGATYGELVDVDDMLPDSTTLARNCEKEANEKRVLISKELKEVISRGGASITVELWTDNYIRRNFLGVTIHFQKDYHMVDIVLGLKSMDFQRSTAANISEKLMSLLSEFDIHNMESIKFVTDRDKNIVKALENNTRLNCSSHLFANVLDKSFDETIELTDTITACKKIVYYFKKTNLPHALLTSLKNPYPTHWNSIYGLFKSILDNWLEVHNILSETVEKQLLLHVDINTLKVIVELCKNFEIIFREIQTCSFTSLCFIMPSINKVKSLCEPNIADITAMSALKENINRNVIEIWENNLCIWQKAAFFLYPPAAHMPLKDLKEIKDFCLSEIEKLDNNKATSSGSSTTPSSTSSDIDCNVLKNEFFFSNLIIKSKNGKESPFDEIEKYCREKVLITEDFEVVTWWKNNEKYYPRLSKFALQVLSIPASSVAAERAFSIVGNVITEKLNRLGPNALDNIVFLHSLYKNNKYINK